MRRWTSICLLLIGILAAHGCSMWKNPPKGWAGATGGEQLERLFWEDVRAKNWAELEKHIASTFTAVTPAGQYSRAEFVNQLKQTNLVDYSLGDFNVQLSGNEFVVTCVMNARGSRSGQPMGSSPVTIMSVWQHLGKGWVLIAHAETTSAARPSAGITVPKM